ncbi:MAG: T9SS type A sorting domain-containing protein, partial [Calditrichaeota bacterium]|nr:T9SS type A sorting domain-containing protein [Calditrichota bacterium]
HDLGEDLWGPMGFYDAYNMDENWFARSYIAIDQGPIIGMIENYRSELLWNLFMSNPEIQPMLDAIGFTTVGIADDPPVATTFALEQNFPNPFNGETIIRFSLPQSETVTLEIFNTLGERVSKIIENKAFIAGTHEQRIDANRFTSGVYFYRITAGDFQKTRKMLLIK